MNKLRFRAAVANSGAMEAETISKHGRSSKSQMSRKNLMRKIILFFAAFCVSASSAFEQDVITLKNGDDIQAIVQEIGDVDIKYKKFDNPNGPNYSLKKSEIFMIRYVNGNKDVFIEQQNHDIEKKDDISIFNAKELEQVLVEALEKISPFEEMCYKIGKSEGVITFYLQEIPPLRKQYRSPLFDIPDAIAEQKLMDVTGGMTLTELKNDVNKRLGRTYPYPPQNVRGRFLEPLLNSYAKEIEELMPYFNKAVDEMEKSSVMKIPKEYRYSFAMETMLKYLRNYRASTWKECADLYEEKLHHLKLEADSEERNRILKEAQTLAKSSERNEQVAAIFKGFFSVVSLISGAVNNAGQDMFTAPRYRETTTIIYD